MAVLVVGASGATGTHLVEQLLIQGQKVKVVVRSPGRLPESWKNNDQLEIIAASLLDLSDKELKELTSDCQSIASCLGHNLSLEGIYGEPRRLVTDATRRLCEAVVSNNPDHPVKFVLMNTNRLLIDLLMYSDNEQAADYLRTQIGQNNPGIEWSVVRPDGLIDEQSVTEYTVHPSPTRSAIFDAGKTSRINVGHFMATLITDDNLWNTWQGQMPVIYNEQKLG